MSHTWYINIFCVKDRQGAAGRKANDLQFWTISQQLLFILVIDWLIWFICSACFVAFTGIDILYIHIFVHVYIFQLFHSHHCSVIYTDGFCAQQSLPAPWKKKYVYLFLHIHTYICCGVLWIPVVARYPKDGPWVVNQLPWPWKIATFKSVFCVFQA